MCKNSILNVIFPRLADSAGQDNNSNNNNNSVLFNTFVFFDLETTGFPPDGEITEISLGSVTRQAFQRVSLCLITYFGSDQSAVSIAVQGLKNAHGQRWTEYGPQRTFEAMNAKEIR